MSRPLILLVVLGASAVAGLVLWVLTDSTTASYIVGIAAFAVGAAALVPPEMRRHVHDLRSRVKVGQAEGSTVSAANLEGGKPIGNVDAEVSVGTAKNSEIVGVRTQVQQPDRTGRSH